MSTLSSPPPPPPPSPPPLQLPVLLPVDSIADLRAEDARVAAELAAVKEYRVRSTLHGALSCCARFFVENLAALRGRVVSSRQLAEQLWNPEALEEVGKTVGRHGGNRNTGGCSGSSRYRQVLTLLGVLRGVGWIEPADGGAIRVTEFAGVRVRVSPHLMTDKYGRSREGVCTERTLRRFGYQDHVSLGRSRPETNVVNALCGLGVCVRVSSHTLALALAVV